MKGGLAPVAGLAAVVAGRAVANPDPAAIASVARAVAVVKDGLAVLGGRCCRPILSSSPYPNPAVGFAFVAAPSALAGLAVVLFPAFWITSHGGDGLLKEVYRES